MVRRLVLLLLVLAVSAETGCGDSGVRTVPVNGKVTFVGGPPPTGGTIIFSPTTVAEGVPNRPGRAQFDKQGSFTVTSFQKDDGLLPGTYHPNISCWKGNPDSNDPSSFERLNYVPKDFKPEPVTVSADADEVNVVINVPELN
jgi:hypothetical protein